MTLNPLQRLLAHTPRDNSLDSLTLRWRTWRIVSSTLLDRRLWPWGRRPLGRDLRRYQAATGVSVMADHAFMEPLEIVYEYGVLGCGAVLVFGGLLVHTWRAGDPAYATALTVWALTMLGSITLRTWPFPLVGALLVLGAWAS